MRKFYTNTRYTYVNSGTPFSFFPEQLTKHPHRERKSSTMMKIHANLVLDAHQDGRRDVFILDPNGDKLTREELIAGARGELVFITSP